MAKKQFEVTLPAVDEQTFTIEASNKNAASNKAIRQWREEHKNPEVAEVTRVGKAGEADDAEDKGGEDQAA